jgi:hypothetical protein
MTELAWTTSRGHWRRERSARIIRSSATPLISNSIPSEIEAGRGYNAGWSLPNKNLACAILIDAHARSEDNRALVGCLGPLRHELPTVIGGAPSKVKLRLHMKHLEAIFLDMNDDSWFARRDRAAYLTLWYTSCRIGRVAPDAADSLTLGHALR